MSNRIGGFRRQFERNFDRTSISDAAQADGSAKGKGRGKGKAGAAAPTSEGLGATAPAPYDPSIPPPNATAGGKQPIGATPAEVLVMQAMMDAYHSNQDDILNKGSAMVASQAYSDMMSRTSVALTSAGENVPPSPEYHYDKNAVASASAEMAYVEYAQQHPDVVAQQKADALNEYQSKMKALGPHASPKQMMDVANELETTMEADQETDVNRELANGMYVQVVPDNSPQADTIDGSTAYITESQMKALEANGVTIPQGQKIVSSSLSDLLSTINNAQKQMSSNTEYTMLQLQTDTQNQNQDASMATGLLKSIGASITTAATDFG